MSMLAERKQKQKWSLQPRGSLWSSDNNKFGQKMLEKMGWSLGSGLGANLNGNVDLVKVSYKNDIKGLGFKENTEQWTEHEDKFSQLLETLKKSEDATIVAADKEKPKSLEEKSQNSRARVHYHKFTRGKDLSRYSEKDLANIFGRKNLEKDEVEKKPEEEEKVDLEDSNHEIHSGSMVDYFKRKKVKVNVGVVDGFKIGANGVLQKEDESEDEARPGFGAFNGNKQVDNDSETEIRAGFGFNKSNLDNPTNESNDQNNSDENAGKSKKKKSKKRKSEDVNDSKSTFISYLQEDTLDNSIKKRKNNEEDNVSNKRVKLDEEETPKKLKKKKKDLGLTNLGFDDNLKNVNEDSITREVVIDDPKEAKRLKKALKKQQKLENGFVNDGFKDFIDQESISADVSLNITNDDPKEAKRLKKLLKKQQKAVNENSVDINSNISDEDLKEAKRLKKLQKMQQENGNCFTNDAFNVNTSVDENSITNNSYEVKKKHKKSGLTNPAFESPNKVQNDSQEIETSNEIDEKEAKRLRKLLKKQKKEAETSGNCNLGFNEGNDAEEVVENSYEVKPKKKKKNKGNKDETIAQNEEKLSVEQKGLDNPGLNLNDTLDDLPVCGDLILNVTSILTPRNAKRGTKRKSVRFSEVNEEFIIPPNIPPESLQNDGIANRGFNGIQENIDDFNKKIDNYQASVENDMNEAKFLEEIKFVGETGPGVDKHQAVEDGVKLSFKHKTFTTKVAPWMKKTGPHSSYKHLIKGDIIVGFKNCNLHAIEGYAMGPKK